MISSSLSHIDSSISSEPSASKVSILKSLKLKMRLHRYIGTDLEPKLYESFITAEQLHFERLFFFLNFYFLPYAYGD